MSINTEDISIPISLTGILSILKEERNSRILVSRSFLMNLTSELRPAFCDKNHDSSRA